MGFFPKKVLLVFERLRPKNEKKVLINIAQQESFGKQYFKKAIQQLSVLLLELPIVLFLILLLLHLLLSFFPFSSVLHMLENKRQFFFFHNGTSCNSFFFS